MDKLQPLEEGIAHLTRMVEDLSDVVTAQGREITRLQARDDYQSELARIVEEAGDLIGEMPE